MNSKNTTQQTLITFNGITMNMSEWDKKLGFKNSTIRNRLNTLKWTIEKAITTPVRVMKKEKKLFTS
jgi:hypothetical protein